MERYLSIVLSEDCHISKTLMANNSYELDKYIYDHFKNSEQVRQKYSLQISSFLDENRNLIHSIEDKTNKMYRGQIVILKVNEDGTLKRIKVIYKSDVMRIKNELLLDQAFMRKFVYNNRKYFSQFIYCKTKNNQSKTFYQKIMNEFYNNIKTDCSFFEFCRTILKYAEEYDDKNSINIVNNKLEKNDNVNLSMFPNDAIDDSDETPDPDWDFHPDLDEVAMGRYPDDDTISYNIEDDSDKKVKTNVKIYKRDPNQLSFFD
ncbi:MAG: hypothetical protein HFI86_01510 [Bacilli bacterium]|nr:hypothetical protein [Bacilli bacterium]